MDRTEYAANKAILDQVFESDLVLTQPQMSDIIADFQARVSGWLAAFGWFSTKERANLREYPITSHLSQSTVHLSVLFYVNCANFLSQIKMYPRIWFSKSFYIITRKPEVLHTKNLMANKKLTKNMFLASVCPIFKKRKIKNLLNLN